jgi:hypothetical protein
MNGFSHGFVDSAALPSPPAQALPPHLNVGKNEAAVRDGIHYKPPFFRHLPVLRHKKA